jgi:hypothetical protein
LGGDLNLETAARRLVEEIASTRSTLRSSFKLEMEAQETQTLMHMAEVYGVCCIRLVRLLKIEKSNSGQLEEYLKEGMDQAIKIAVKKLGLTN